MTYEEMQELQRKLAEKLGGDAIPFEPGETPTIGLEDFDGVTLFLTIELA